jgi:hypothetical protein
MLIVGGLLVIVIDWRLSFAALVVEYFGAPSCSPNWCC